VFRQSIFSSFQWKHYHRGQLWCSLMFWVLIWRCCLADVMFSKTFLWQSLTCTSIKACSRWYLIISNNNSITPKAFGNEAKSTEQLLCEQVWCNPVCLYEHFVSSLQSSKMRCYLSDHVNLQNSMPTLTKAFIQCKIWTTKTLYFESAIFLFYFYS